MTETRQTPASLLPALRVAAGEDRFGEHRGLGISKIDFKVTPQDESGLLILENTFHAKGGPARHLHYDQDEWFYAIEGEFIFEIGQERFTLKPGDSLLGPRRVPHVWAYVGDSTRQDSDRVHARRQNGSFLSRGDESERHAAAGPGDCGGLMAWSYLGHLCWWSS